MALVSPVTLSVWARGRVRDDVTCDWTQSLPVMKHLGLTTSLDRLPPSASQGQGQGRATRQPAIPGQGCRGYRQTPSKPMLHAGEPK